jgi:ParB-like chromosome segregation protein Spo0J
MGWAARVRNLWRQGRVDAEIEEELRAHIEMAMEDGVRAGMTEEQARRAARVRFGNPVTVKERTRRWASRVLGGMGSSRCGN